MAVARRARAAHAARRGAGPGLILGLLAAAAGCGEEDPSARLAEAAAAEIVVMHASAAHHRVPETDTTPPLAVMRLRDGARSLSSISPVRDDGDRPLDLKGSELDLLAVIRDPEGTGRIRVSLTYERRCADGATRRWTHHFPPSEIASVKLPPGAEAPVERRRRARVRLRPGGEGCTVRGEAWADATNASGLESFSDQIPFELRGK